MTSSACVLAPPSVDSMIVCQSYVEQNIPRVLTKCQFGFLRAVISTVIMCSYNWFFFTALSRPFYHNISKFLFVVYQIVHKSDGCSQRLAPSYREVVSSKPRIPLWIFLINMHFWSLPQRWGKTSRGSLRVSDRFWNVNQYSVRLSIDTDYCLYCTKWAVIGIYQNSKLNSLQAMTLDST